MNIEEKQQLYTGKNKKNKKLASFHQIDKMNPGKSHSCVLISPSGPLQPLRKDADGWYERHYRKLLKP